MRKSTCRPAFGTRPRPADCFWIGGLLVRRRSPELRAMPAVRAGWGAMSIASHWLGRFTFEQPGSQALSPLVERACSSSACVTSKPCAGTPLLISHHLRFACMPSADSLTLLTSGLVRVVQTWRLTSGCANKHSQWVDGKRHQIGTRLRAPLIARPMSPPKASVRNTSCSCKFAL